MISIIENYCVEEKNWITHEDMMNITVIAESTPGPVAINCATFVGYKRRGVIGAATATVGVVLPSFIIIYFITLLLDGFLEITIIANAFRGIKLAVGIIILGTAVKMVRQMNKKAFEYIILVCSALTMLVIDIYALRLSTIAILIIAGVLSLIVYSLGRKSGETK